MGYIIGFCVFTGNCHFLNAMSLNSGPVAIHADLRSAEYNVTFAIIYEIDILFVFVRFYFLKGDREAVSTGFSHKIHRIPIFDEFCLTITCDQIYFAFIAICLVANS